MVMDEINIYIYIYSNYYSMYWAKIIKTRKMQMTNKLNECCQGQTLPNFETQEKPIHEQKSEF
jgi:hypothetical protein